VEGDVVDGGTEVGDVVGGTEVGDVVGGVVVGDVVGTVVVGVLDELPLPPELTVMSDEPLE
jgi:hypothetical protein